MIDLKVMAKNCAAAGTICLATASFGGCQKTSLPPGPNEIIKDPSRYQGRAIELDGYPRVGDLIELTERRLDGPNLMGDFGQNIRMRNAFIELYLTNRCLSDAPLRMLAHSKPALRHDKVAKDAYLENWARLDSRSVRIMGRLFLDDIGNFYILHLRLVTLDPVGKPERASYLIRELGLADE